MGAGVSGFCKDGGDFQKEGVRGGFMGRDGLLEQCRCLRMGLFGLWAGPQQQGL